MQRLTEYLHCKNLTNSILGDFQVGDVNDLNYTQNSEKIRQRQPEAPSVLSDPLIVTFNSRSESG